MEDIGGLQLWVREIHQQTMGLSFKVKETLFTGKSRFQKIDIVQTYSHGAMLLNDGLIMLSERDEFIYHEMIAHVPLFVHPDPKRVLVIGGGDGGTVREILKHPRVEHVVLVEIDGMVVKACKAHMPTVSYGLEDPKVTVLIEDGIKYVRDTDERFDIVIVDSTDPVGPGVALFEKPFYQNIKERLTPDGIMVTQAESPFYDTGLQKSMFSNQRSIFERLNMYLFSTTIYPGGLWSFGFASKGLCPLNDFDPDRVRNANIPTRYYTPDVHRAAFALPVFIQQHMNQLLDPLLKRNTKGY